MAFEQEAQYRVPLEATLEKLGKFSSESLAKKDLGPTLSFEKFVPVFDRTLNLFKSLAECSLDTIPYPILNDLLQRANIALESFKKVAEFSLETYQTNPIQQRDAFGDQIFSEYRDHYTVVSPAIAYSIRKGTDFAKLETDAKQTVEAINTKLEQVKQSIGDKLKDVEGIVEKVRRAAQEVGVAQHNLLFSDEATDHKATADTWLKVTGGLATITFAFAVGFLGVYLFSDRLEKLPQSSLIATKVLLFGILISATLWAGRIYRAHRHNYVVNKHRANALTTFETFVKGTSDQQTKDAVLIQATQCIFSSQPSGYITQESDGGMYKQIFEIVRGDTAKR